MQGSTQESGCPHASEKDLKSSLLGMGKSFEGPTTRQLKKSWKPGRLGKLSRSLRQLQGPSEGIEKQAICKLPRREITFWPHLKFENLNCEDQPWWHNIEKTFLNQIYFNMILIISQS